MEISESHNGGLDAGDISPYKLVVQSDANETKVKYIPWNTAW